MVFQNFPDNFKATLLERMAKTLRVILIIVLSHPCRKSGKYPSNIETRSICVVPILKLLIHKIHMDSEIEKSKKPKNVNLSGVFSKLFIFKN
jgi:hypothetical protein